MLLALLPLVAVSLGSPDDTVVTTSPRSAQVRLADLLADADSIDAVRAHRQTFTFAIMRGDEPYSVVASTSSEGDVVDVVLRERVASDLDLGSLSWLADTMKQTIAVTNLDADEDGAVTLTTADGVRYMAIPGRGSGGTAADGNDEDDGPRHGHGDPNTAVEARFAAQVGSEPRG
jgi:hypothetical protein